MLNPPPLFLNKQVKILLFKILDIFLAKLIFLPFERVSCGVVDVVINYMKWVSLNLVPRDFPFSFPFFPPPPHEKGKALGTRLVPGAADCV